MFLPPTSRLGEKLRNGLVLLICVVNLTVFQITPSPSSVVRLTTFPIHRSCWLTSHIANPILGGPIIIVQSLNIKIAVKQRFSDHYFTKNFQNFKDQIFSANSLEVKNIDNICACVISIDWYPNILWAHTRLHWFPMFWQWVTPVNRWN